jgi:hypothetical protein
VIVDFKKTWLLNDKGFGTSVRDFKSILDDNGLKATSNHFDFNSMIKDGSTDLFKIT